MHVHISQIAQICIRDTKEHVAIMCIVLCMHERAHVKTALRLHRFAPDTSTRDSSVTREITLRVWNQSKSTCWDSPHITCMTGTSCTDNSVAVHCSVLQCVAVCCSVHVLHLLRRHFNPISKTSFSNKIQPEPLSQEESYIWNGEWFFHQNHSPLALMAKCKFWRWWMEKKCACRVHVSPNIEETSNHSWARAQTGGIGRWSPAHTGGSGRVERVLSVHGSQESCLDCIWPLVCVRAMCQQHHGVEQTMSPVLIKSAWSHYI